MTAMNNADYTDRIIAYDKAIVSSIEALGTINPWAGLSGPPLTCSCGGIQVAAAGK